MTFTNIIKRVFLILLMTAMFDYGASQETREYDCGLMLSF